MRNYGLNRYMTYNNYRHSSLYSRSRTSIAQQFATKSNSANAARKAYQNTSAAKSTAYTGSLSDAVSGIASSVSDMSRAMSGNDRGKMYDAVKNFVDSYNDMHSAVKNSRNAFVSGRTALMESTAKAYSGTLENAGVTVSDDGSLSLDKEKFMSADDRTITTALGKNSGFTGAAVSQAVNVSRYADGESYTGFGGYSKNDIFGYAGTTRAGILSSYLFDKFF